ncbi:MAG: BNR-repeat neuraminidase N-terminal domain-containing protein, partial [Bacteroidaceae bacterium]
MNKTFLLVALFLNIILGIQASDTIFVRETRIPVMIERQDNVLFKLRLDAKKSQRLDKVILKFGQEVNL